MPATGRHIVAATLVLLLLATEEGNAQPRRQAVLTGLSPNSKTTLIVAVLVTTVGLIGAGVYLGIRRGHSAKGCVANGPNGLELQTQDNNSLLLLGNATGITPGHRVRLTGSKKKKLAGVNNSPSFVVEHLIRDYGACSTVRP